MTDPKVVRYDCVRYRDYPMEPAPEGDWVSYDDYARLAKRVKELKAELEDIEEYDT